MNYDAHLLDRFDPEAIAYSAKMAQYNAQIAHLDALLAQIEAQKAKQSP